MRIYGSFSSINETTIEILEKVEKIQLPEEYKAFLLKHNGGYPDPNCFWFTYPGGSQWTGGINFFYGITDQEHQHSLMANLRLTKGGLPERFLPIADNGGGNYTCICIYGENKGKIYYVLHDAPIDEGVIEIASNFDELLANLVDVDDD